MPAADRAYLSRHASAVLAAKARAPRQWRTWWWVCAAGQFVFLPTVLLLRGRWRRSAALRDIEEHERLIDAELARLSLAAAQVAGAGGATGGAPVPRVAG